MELRDDRLGVPRAIVKAYRDIGVERLWPWQEECLFQQHPDTKKCAIEGANLVFSGPTSGGKTLVAEMIMLQTILKRRRKVLYVLPYKALVEEKITFTRRVFGSHFRRSKLGIGSFYGGQGGSKRLMSIELAIGTPERISSLLNSLIHSNRLDTIGAVIVDEIHYLGNASRGHRIEGILAKILFACERFGLHIQIVGMTATIGNQDVVAQWLSAISFKAAITRPVPLRQFLICEEGVFDVDGRRTTEFAVPERPFEDKGQVHSLVGLTLGSPDDAAIAEADGAPRFRSQLLVFCPTKRQADEDAAALRKQLLCSREGCPEYAEHGGVEVHHAGKSKEILEEVENKFSGKMLDVLFCTNTLAAGVNLPSQRVVIRDLRVGRSPLTVAEYHQMIGRAGRYGLAQSGESFLFCRDKTRGLNFMRSSPDDVRPHLLAAEQAKTLSFMLEAVVTGLINSPTTGSAQVCDVEALLTKTLGWRFQKSDVKALLAKLVEDDMLITVSIDGCNYVQYTQLGSAAVFASFTPKQALGIWETLSKDSGSSGAKLDCDLTMLVHLAPVFCVVDINWAVFNHRLTRLSAKQKKSLQDLGVQEGLVVNFANNAPGRFPIVYDKAFKALILYDLINEIPMDRIANAYCLSQGCVEGLQEQTEMFARCMQAFCSHVPNLKTRQVMLKSFERRIRWRSKADVLQMIKIPGMSTELASYLVRANNIRSPLALSQTSVIKLSRCLTAFLRASKSFHTAMTPFLQANQAIIPCDENTPPGEDATEDQDVFEQLALEIIRRAEKVVEDDDTEVVINDLLLDRYYAKRVRT